MKKAPLFAALIGLAVVLTACGSANSSANNFGSGATRTLSPEAKLALGTIKLEGTKQAVDSKMAAKLVPLWQLMVQLNSSSSSAPQEVTAVMDEIRATMTPEQLTTINSMSLTQADVFSVFQEQAQSGGTGGSGGNGGTSSFGNRNRGGGQAFVFGGGPGGPGGFGGFGGGFGGAGARNNNGASSQLTAAQQAEAAQARQNATADLVINQLVRLLQTKFRS